MLRIAAGLEEGAEDGGVLGSCNRRESCFDMFATVVAPTLARVFEDWDDFGNGNVGVVADSFRVELEMVGVGEATAVGNVRSSGDCELSCERWALSFDGRVFTTNDSSLRFPRFPATYKKSRISEKC
jgi:hypothetical protein